MKVSASTGRRFEGPPRVRVFTWEDAKVRRSFEGFSLERRKVRTLFVPHYPTSNED